MKLPDLIFSFFIATVQGITLLAQSSATVDWLGVAERFGVLAVIVVFLFWRDWQKERRDDLANAKRDMQASEREASMANQIRSTEEFVREVLLKRGDEQAVVLKQNSETMKTFAENQSEHIRLLHEIRKEAAA